MFKKIITEIETIITQSEIPEDPLHAENTLEWLLKFRPAAGLPLRIAAYAHDIERAIRRRRVFRDEYDKYDSYKEAHARNGAKILREILEKSEIPESIIKEACRLVSLHEVGGDVSSNLLKDADSISFFEVNLPLYFEREGWAETKRRCLWGYRRISKQRQNIVSSMNYKDGEITRLLKEVIREAI